ncbi:hypothetical protein KFY46_25410 [Salmonella enterica subsp. enterica serovar 1,4,[5],12:i:-]|nr:hypothetical protein [Salmonella enterica subsp. enterica serovar 1,4,[5],12:i:-]
MTSLMSKELKSAIKINTTGNWVEIQKYLKNSILIQKQGLFDTQLKTQDFCTKLENLQK